MPYRAPDLHARLEPLPARDAEARWAQAVKRIAEIQRRLEGARPEQGGGDDDTRITYPPPAGNGAGGTARQATASTYYTSIAKRSATPKRQVAGELPRADTRARARRYASEP